MIEKERVQIRGEGIKKERLERIPKEIEGWLEKVEKGDIYLAKPVIDDQTGQTLVTAPSAKKPKIILPLTRQQIVSGLKQKTTEAIRWLAEWCLRLIKIRPKEVALKKAT